MISEPFCLIGAHEDAAVVMHFAAMPGAEAVLLNTYAAE